MRWVNEYGITLSVDAPRSVPDRWGRRWYHDYGFAMSREEREQLRPLVERACRAEADGDEAAAAGAVDIILSTYGVEVDKQIQAAAERQRQVDERQRQADQEAIQRTHAALNEALADMRSKRSAALSLLEPATPILDDNTKREIDADRLANRLAEREEKQARLKVQQAEARAERTAARVAHYGYDPLDDDYVDEDDDLDEDDEELYTNARAKYGTEATVNVDAHQPPCQREQLGRVEASFSTAAMDEVVERIREVRRRLTEGSD